MIKWAPYPFVRITLAFMAGIMLARLFEPEGYAIAWLFLPFLALFLGLYIFAKKRRSAFLFSLAGIAAFVSFGLTGWLLSGIRSEKNQKEHLWRISGQVTHYTGYIDDFLLEKPAIIQTRLRLQKVKVNGQWQIAEGHIQLTFRRDSLLHKPAYGDVLLIKGAPQAVAPPLNPGQFDFRRYLAFRNIYHQHFLNSGQFERVGRHIPDPVMALSMQLRRNLDRVLKKFVPSQREYAIASALVLGVKDELDNSIKTTYSNTGTMHVLAVSGLHVGLVIAVLSFLLRPLRQTRPRKIVAAAIILVFVWGYAFITALSPSVLRAAVMFSFVVGAQVLQRRANIYNTLATAAFVLLCFNPFYLFEVGFQLSFVAVLAIVYLQPRLYRLLEFDHAFSDWLWKLITVSVAAQIGTFPLGLYYFHQFPVYFLVSNLIAVPLATLILYNGIALIVFFAVPGLNVLLGKMLQGLVWLMNESLLLLENWPSAVLNRIPFSALQTGLLYTFLLFLLVFLARRNLKILGAACLVLAFFSASQLKYYYSENARPKLIIFAVTHQSVWGFLGKNATVLADPVFAENKQAVNFNLEPALMATGTRDVHFQSWQRENAGNLAQIRTAELQLFSWRGLQVLALEKPLQRDLKNPITIDYLVIRKNAWITPEKLRRNFRYKTLILDSSNENWYAKWLAGKLQPAGIPFHDVRKQGAFVIQP